MSRTTREEYLQRRQRYRSRERAGKSAMIDEVSDTLGWSRQHTINLESAVGKRMMSASRVR